MKKYPFSCNIVCSTGNFIGVCLVFVSIDRISMGRQTARSVVLGCLAALTVASMLSGVSSARARPDLHADDRPHLMRWSSSFQDAAADGHDETARAIHGKPSPSTNERMKKSNPKPLPLHGWKLESNNHPTGKTYGAIQTLVKTERSPIRATSFHLLLKVLKKR